MAVRVLPIRLFLGCVLSAALLLGSAATSTATDSSNHEFLEKDLREIRKELSRTRQQLQHQLDALDERLRALDLRLKSQGAPPSNGMSPTAPDAGGGTGEPPAGSPTVCREGCLFSDLDKAIEASASGGTITVAPGLTGTCGIIDKPLRLVGLKDPSGKRAHLAGGVCWGKSPLVVRAPDVTIEGFEISNVSVGSNNGACVRIDPEAGDVTIRDLHCHDNQTGVLGGPNSGTVTIEDSLFERNGMHHGKGQAHGIYITSGDQLILRNTRILATKGLGHTLKSGAKRTVIENSTLAGLDGPNSRAIDAYGGGEVIVRNSVIQQGENSDNHDAIGIAFEPKRINPEPHWTLVENSWIIFDDLERCCRWPLHGKQFGPITLRGNKIVGMTDLAGSRLTVSEEGNLYFSTREKAGLSPYDGTLASLPSPQPLQAD